MDRMQYSGYRMEERVKVYRTAKRRYKELVRKDMEGVQSLCRSKDWNMAERVKENNEIGSGSKAIFFLFLFVCYYCPICCFHYYVDKKKKKEKKGNGTEGVFFVDATLKNVEK